MAEVKGNNTRYIAWLVILGLAILAGLFATYKVLTEGLTMYAANDTVVWTLPLVAYTFFSLLSAGSALVAAFPQVLGILQYDALIKRATMLAVGALIAAFVCMFLELGSPWKMISYITSPNPSSSLWWLGVLYLMQLVFLVIMLWRLKKGQSVKVLSILVFLMAIACATTLGSTFGLVEARSFFFGEFMPVYFLLNASLIGLAVTLLVCKIVSSEKNASLFDELGKILQFALGVTLIFFIWRNIVGSYASSQEYEVAKHMTGTFLYQVGLWLGLVLPFLLLILPALKKTLWAQIAAAGLVLVGEFVRIILYVESGLSIAGDPRLNGLPSFATTSYTVWEWLVVVFALAVLMLLYTLGEKYFKLEAASS
jgi:molybdopterin-containing oxidoreductase family membrane subunit